VQCAEHKRAEAAKAEEERLKKAEADKKAAAEKAAKEEREKKEKEEREKRELELKKKREEEEAIKAAREERERKQRELEHKHQREVQRLRWIVELQRETAWLTAAVIETEIIAAPLPVSAASTVTAPSSPSTSAGASTAPTSAAAAAAGLSSATLALSTLPSPSEAAAEAPASVQPASTKAEVRNAAELKWLDSNLLRCGFEQNTLTFEEADLHEPSVADGEDDDSDSEGEGEGDSKEPLQLSRRLTPGSKSAVITMADSDRFGVDMVNGTADALRFYDWMCAHLKKEFIGQVGLYPRQSAHWRCIVFNLCSVAVCPQKNPFLDKAARASFAAILKHTGLLAEAISYARLVAQKGSKISNVYKPATELITVWREAQAVCAVLKAVQALFQR
jgi:hypothetical protein